MSAVAGCPRTGCPPSSARESGWPAFSVLSYSGQLAQTPAKPLLDPPLRLEGPDGLVNHILDLFAPEAQVHQGGDEVLLLLRSPGREHLFLLLDFFLELERDPGGQLLADPRDEGDPGHVGVLDRLLELGRADPRKDIQGQLGPDAGDADELQEYLPLLARREPVEGKGAVCKMGVDMEFAGAPLVAQMQISGDGDVSAVADTADVQNDLAGGFLPDLAFGTSDHPFPPPADSSTVLRNIRVLR